MNRFNTTLHKQALQRKKELRRLAEQGLSKRQIAQYLGISRQRVYQILSEK